MIQRRTSIYRTERGLAFGLPSPAAAAAVGRRLWPEGAEVAPEAVLEVGSAERVDLRGMGVRMVSSSTF